jgi:8-oxo-dGTP diphosphatase
MSRARAAPARSTSTATASSCAKPENRPLKTVDIVAGALFDARGRVLIAQRPAGKELAGRWEFPGGKLLADERLLRYSHLYPDKRVWLDMWIVSNWSGDARGLDGQALRWVTVRDLADEDILEADQPIIEALIERERSRA